MAQWLGTLRRVEWRIGVFHVRVPKLATGIQHMKQFVNDWHLPCYHCREACAHVSCIQKQYAYASARCKQPRSQVMNSPALIGTLLCAVCLTIGLVPFSFWRLSFVDLLGTLPTVMCGEYVFLMSVVQRSRLASSTWSISLIISIYPAASERMSSCFFYTKMINKKIYNNDIVLLCMVHHEYEDTWGICFCYYSQCCTSDMTKKIPTIIH